MTAETEFSAEFRSTLTALKQLDVVRMETAIDDGLPDYLLLDRQTGLSTFVELKIGHYSAGGLRFPTLQAAQVNFLQSRLPHARAFLFIRAEGDLFWIPVRASVEWLRGILLKRLTGFEAASRLVTWEDLPELLFSDIHRASSAL